MLFVDASARFAKGKNQNVMADEDIAMIAAAQRVGEDHDDGGGVQVRLVDHTEVKENGWDLSLTRYLKTAADEGIDVPTALAELREAQATLREAEVRLAERLRAAGYG